MSEQEDRDAKAKAMAFHVEAESQSDLSDFDAGGASLSNLDQK